MPLLKPHEGLPKYEFQATLEAIHTLCPGYNLDGVDILTNRNTLRKLLGFVAPLEFKDKPFRLRLSLINSTLILEPYRWTEQWNSHSYGKSMETLCAKFPPGLEHSVSHHRVISYKMGPLNCIVKAEADAFYEFNGLEESSGLNVPEQNEWVLGRLPLPENGAVGSSTVSSHFSPATQMMDSPAGSSPSSRLTRPPASKAGNIKMSGTMVPQKQIIEVKTQRGEETTEFIRSSHMAQLWLGRTDHKVSGLLSESDPGLLERVDHEPYVDEFENWEERNQESLQKLVSVLMELRRAVAEQVGKEGKKGPFIAICREPGYSDRPRELHLFECPGEKTDVLPGHIVQSMWSN